MSRHVLFIHDNRSLGGVGAVAAQLAGGLRERGWSVDDLQLAAPAKAAAAALRVARRRGVIVATQNFSTAYVAAALAALAMRPWVMCVHGPVTRVLEAARPSASKRRLLHATYRRAPAIVCSSQASLDSLRAFCETGTRQHVEVIRNTAAPAFFAAAASLPRPAKRLGFVGRLSPEKQPHLLVEALRRLPSDWHLDVIGTGPLAEELARMAGPEVASGRMRLAGVQPVDAGTYRQWQATLLCSSYEGYPLVLLESLAAGVPVVSTPIPPAVEMLGPHAPSMLARDAAAESIAQAVLALDARDAAQVSAEIAAVNRAHEPAAFIAQWDALLSRMVAP